ncbi:hypothetical protein AC623_07425 [Bacillus sp. FJAT-27231]|uniref:hypothetical protein n=1 Tax=Bacillus sp. FJAT-27231 TaxID=1679168 RepID=UPI0006708E02|nr:hypothetical protein [Bacillus sp. FJAT-27231]KMY53827.1 hypothetical protein AC623_07425 [Bacillus sp. FJAT-27231]
MAVENKLTLANSIHKNLFDLNEYLACHCGPVFVTKESRLSVPMRSERSFLMGLGSWSFEYLCLPLLECFLYSATTQHQKLIIRPEKLIDFIFRRMI